MKIKCDVCSSELIMNMDCSGAVCSVCGVTYSIERLREMLSENRSETDNKEIEEPVVEPVKEDPEELPYIFFCAEQQDMDEKEIGFGALLRVEYDIYTDGKMEIVYDYDKGENYCQIIAGKERLEKDLMFNLTDEEFSAFLELLGDTEGVEPAPFEGGMKWSFELYSEKGETYNKKVGSVDNSPEFSKLTSFLINKHKMLKAVWELYVFARTSAENKYKRLYKYLEMEPSEISRVDINSLLDQVLADITEREIPDLNEKLERIDNGEDASILFSGDKKEEVDSIPSVSAEDDNSLLFTAKECNGSANFQDRDYWCNTEYEIYNNKKISVTYKYNKSGLSKPDWKEINDSDFDNLLSAISEIHKAKPSMMCDWTFWNFKQYHNGQEISKISSDESDPYAKKLIEIIKRVK